MKNKETGVILLVLGIALIAGFFFWGNNSSELDWSKKLGQKSYDPYDLGHFKNILRKSAKRGFENHTKKLEGKLVHHKPANYFLMSKASYFTKKEFSALKKFIAKGNDAFIAVNHLDKELASLLDFAVVSNSYIDKQYNCFLNDFPEKTYPFRFYDQKGLKNTQLKHFYVPDEGYDSTTVLELGHYQRKSAKKENLAWWYTNCLNLRIGKGTLTVHVNPLLFSNLSLNSKIGLEYANDLLSFMDNKPIIWDEYNSHYNFESNDSQNSQLTDTPLQFILKHKSLKTAWYVLLAGALLFLLFKSKRKQNIIPILPQLENTSLEFSKSLGALYLQAGNGKALAIELMTLFDNYNRRKYRIHRHVKDGSAAELIAKKSRVDIDLVKQILLMERKTVFNPDSNIKDVMPLYEAIKEYYHKSKR